jgi:hypothetical protein
VIITILWPAPFLFISNVTIISVMKRRASRPSFELNLDPPGETLWRLFLVGAVAAVGAAVSLWLLAFVAGLVPFVGAYLESATTLVLVSVAWAALVPAVLAAKQNRPYLLAIPVLYAFLGVTDAGIFQSTIVVSGLIVVLALFVYHRRTARPRYR